MKTVKTNGNLEPQSQEEKYSQKNKNKEFSQSGKMVVVPSSYYVSFFFVYQTILHCKEIQLLRTFFFRGKKYPQNKNLQNLF